MLNKSGRSLVALIVLIVFTALPPLCGIALGIYGSILVLTPVTLIMIGVEQFGPYKPAQSPIAKVIFGWIKLWMIVMWVAALIVRYNTIMHMLRIMSSP